MSALDYLKTPCGELEIIATEQGLTAVNFVETADKTIIMRKASLVSIFRVIGSVSIYHCPHREQRFKNESGMHLWQLTTVKRPAI